MNIPPPKLCCVSADRLACSEASRGATRRTLLHESYRCNTQGGQERSRVLWVHDAAVISYQAADHGLYGCSDVYGDHS